MSKIEKRVKGDRENDREIEKPPDQARRAHKRAWWTAWLYRVGFIGKKYKSQMVIFLETIQYTRYEKSRIIGARALQLSMGATSFDKSQRFESHKHSEAEYEKDVIPDNSGAIGTISFLFVLLCYKF